MRVFNLLKSQLPSFESVDLPGEGSQFIGIAIREGLLILWNVRKISAENYSVLRKGKFEKEI